MARNKATFPLKPVILTTVFFVIFIVAGGYAISTLKNLDYFDIRDIAANKPQGAPDLSYLSGRNIFSIDLNKESRYISELYPVYKNIRIFRIFPNRLFVAITDRKAVAYLKLYRYFCVDSDGVLFDLTAGQQQAQDLPVITGLERKAPAARAGKECNIRELYSALNIIKGVNSDILLRKYKIKRIDLQSPANIICFIQLAENSGVMAAAQPKALEVRMPQDGINDKLRVLAGVFNQLNGDMNNIAYIDLRFKEPVIKFNEVKGAK